MRVWIDQDLCTGDGLCVDHCHDVFEILEDGIASRSADIDVVWMNGYGFPRYRGGPMHYADSVGLDKVLARVREFRDRFGSLYWEPPKLLTELAESNRSFSDL